MPTRKSFESYRVSLGELLKKPVTYRVPHYQRDFSWTKEEIDTLWEDITGAFDGGDKDYFLGSIVIAHEEDEKIRVIIDGQQRLAALSMILSAISSAWHDLGDEKRSVGVSRDYLGGEDRRTGVIIPKLTLNETNDSVFQSVVLQRGIMSPSHKKIETQSNKLIDEAFLNIKLQLEERLEKGRDKRSSLLDFEDFVSEKLILIVIEVEEDTDAFVIFETLNDRGLDLAISDLVKNYIFSKAGTNIERFKRTWGDISTIVGSENITQFLRYYWISSHKLVRERDLYKELRSSMRNSATVRDFVDKIRKVADLYAALQNPEHSYWTDFSAETISCLDALLTFKIVQFRSVALAAMEKFDPRTVAEILRMLMIVSFRYSIVSASSPGILEKIYSSAAVMISTGKAKNAKAVFGTLKRAYWEDSRFMEDFGAKRFTNPKIARYILAQINDELEGDTEKTVAERSGRITLEHILPKNPGKEWKGAYASEEEFNEVVDRIGNLTLLEKGRNRGISNAGFAKKRSTAFKQSTLILNRDIAKKKSWTVANIKERSKTLAETAKRIWRLDY